MWIKFLATASVALAMACRQDEVTHARVPKEEAPAPASAPGMGGGGDVSPSGAPERGLRWTLPNGWSEDRAAGGMRYATLKAPVAGKVDVSVTVLPGSAGGELANVNRWRNQIGLPPIDQAALASARKPVKAPAGAVSLYDFASESGDKRRMVAGLLEKDGNSWFVKMVGDAEAVGAARKDFLRLLETLRFDATP